MSFFPALAVIKRKERFISGRNDFSVKIQIINQSGRTGVIGYFKADDIISLFQQIADIFFEDDPVIAVSIGKRLAVDSNFYFIIHRKRNSRPARKPGKFKAAFAVKSSLFPPQIIRMC